MFLSIKGARSGVIKGEAHDSKHLGEIDVVSWSWGIQGRPSFGGKPAGQASVRELTVHKRVDRASTALMSAVRTNEPISKAVLTVRKSGKSPLEFLKITIEQGRVTGISIEAGSREQSPELFEDVVEYIQQGADGQSTGSTVYADSFDEQS
jgi:type VI secretion system secreted protein Hcp